jgi:hypothetical protein
VPLGRVTIMMIMIHRDWHHRIRKFSESQLRLRLAGRGARALPPQ